jgi:ornithine--oxo-acid transaminase
MMARLRAFAHPALKGVRGRGLWAGAEMDPHIVSAREVCERLLAKGVLSKETHRTVVRLAPPLVIAADDLDRALDRFAEVLEEIDRRHGRRKAADARSKEQSNAHSPSVAFSDVPSRALCGELRH